MRMTGDINTLRDMVVDAPLRGVSAGLVLIIMTGVMLAMDWRLTMLVLSVLPLLALTTFNFSFRIREAARRQRKNEGRLGSMVSEMLASIKLIQASGNEPHEEKRFNRKNRQSHKSGLRVTRLEATQSRVIEILMAAATAGVLWYGVNRVRTGVLTPGDLLVFVAYVHAALKPMRHLARVSTRLSKAVVCAERLTEILHTTVDVQDRPDAKHARQLRGRIEFRHVSFNYPGATETLKSLSFTVEPGKTVALVGPSGAGKSTILALLLRLYDPQEGTIRIDGRDVRRYRLRSMREQVSLVLQEPMLFGASVKENIAFGCREVSDAQIHEAAELAGAHGFICDLSEGYDTPLAEAGASLSGGQRQRIAISRAFLRDAPILVLDEPLLGLDARSAFKVRSALGRLMEGRATIVIAHELDAVRGADEILVLSKGRIVERGTHEALLRAGEWYAQAWSLQNASSPTAKISSRAKGGGLQS